MRSGIIASALIFFGLVGGGASLLTWGLVIGGLFVVRPYLKLAHRDGYDWRDVFKQPRDRLFFDVAAESIDSARALFDRDKRVAFRQRMQAFRAADNPAALPPAEPVGRTLPPPPYAPAPNVGAVPQPGASSVAGAPLPPVSWPPAAREVGDPIPRPVPDEADGLASPDVLNGAHGGVVRRAAADRAAVHQEVSRLGAADRALLPDVVSTVDALVVRIAALATALHRLDGDLAPDALPELDKRIAGAEAGPVATPDRERKLALLRRQRATLQDLADRRAALSAQLESAGLILQNIRFDLLRLRSAGVQSAIDDVTSATQEARALSREIGHVLNAAEEIKAI